MPKIVQRQRGQRKHDDTVVQLTTLNYQAPAVGIFDEPNRCYRLNNEWAKIVFGWLDWLASEECWQGDANERIRAVQELTRFFVAVECGEMTDCADLADCIENDPNIALLLNNFIDNALADVVPNLDNPISSDRRTTDLMPENIDCELDTIFGIVTGVVDGLHTACIDAIQIMEVASTAIELAATLADNAGIFTLAPASALETASWLQDQIIDVYNGSYTDGVRNEIRCALFCQAKEGCSLSIDDVFSTYAALTGLDANNILSFESMVSNITAFINNPPLNIVTLFHLLIISAMRWGSDFFDLTNFLSLGTMMELASNNPDPDHEILCVTCLDEFWEHTADFLGSLGGYQLVQGQYIGGSVKGVVVDPDAKQCQVTLQLPETIHVRGVEINFHVQSTPGGQENVISCRLRPIIGSNAGSNLIIITNYGTVSGPKVRCQVRGPSIGTFMCREIVVTLRIGHNVNQTGDCFLDKVRLWGEQTPTPPNGITLPSQPQCTP